MGDCLKNTEVHKFLETEELGDPGSQGSHWGRRKSVSLGMRERWGKSSSVALVGGGVCNQHMVQVECSDTLELFF